jgi:hypothetical protein
LPSAPSAVKRLHDLDKSGILALFMFVPVANIAVYLGLLITSGDESDNKYGKPPSSDIKEEPTTTSLKEEISEKDCYKNEVENKYVPLTPEIKDKYGWGWLIFIGILAQAATPLKSPFSSLAFEGAWFIIIMILLIPYFRLRRKLTVKNPGLVAGFYMLIVGVLILGAMIFFDAKSMYSEITKVTAAYKDEIYLRNQTEAKYQATLITNPQNATDIKQNIKTIDEILEYLNTKQQFTDSLFYAYNGALINKRNPKKNKLWGELINQVVSLSHDVNLKHRKSLGLQRDFYVNGNEKSYQEYKMIYQEAAQLENELQRLIKELFL